MKVDRRGCKPPHFTRDRRRALADARDGDAPTGRDRGLADDSGEVAVFDNPTYRGRLSNESNLLLHGFKIGYKSFRGSCGEYEYSAVSDDWLGGCGLVPLGGLRPDTGTTEYRSRVSTLPRIQTARDLAEIAPFHSQVCCGHPAVAIDDRSRSVTVVGTAAQVVMAESALIHELDVAAPPSTSTKSSWCRGRATM